MTILNCVINAIAYMAILDWKSLYRPYLQITQWGLELIANIIVTILIAYKAWFVIFSKPY